MWDEGPSKLNNEQTMAFQIDSLHGMILFKLLANKVYFKFRIQKSQYTIEEHLLLYKSFNI